MVLLYSALFLPGSRAGVMELYGNDSVAIADGSLSAEVRGQPFDGRLLAEASGRDVWYPPFGEYFLWILGGMVLATIAGIAFHMMPGLEGRFRNKNCNCRVRPA